jgi:hypothetical protein
MWGRNVSLAPRVPRPGSDSGPMNSCNVEVKPEYPIRSTGGKLLGSGFPAMLETLVIW